MLTKKINTNNVRSKAFEKINIFKNKIQNKNDEINVKDLVSKLSDRVDYTKIKSLYQPTLGNARKKKLKNLPKLQIEINEDLQDNTNSSSSTIHTMSELRIIFRQIRLKVTNIGQMASYQPIIELYSTNYLLAKTNSQSSADTLSSNLFKKEYSTLKTIYQQQTENVTLPKEGTFNNFGSLFQSFIAICYDPILDPKPNLDNLNSLEDLISFANSNRQVVFIPEHIKLKRLNPRLRKQIIQKENLAQFTLVEKKE